MSHGNLMRSEPAVAGHPMAAGPPAGHRPRATRKNRPDGLADFRMIGLNWETATLEEREKVALRALHHPAPALDTPGTRCREALLLSTCNRLEFYALHPGPLAEDPIPLLYFAGIEPSHLYERNGAEAARHLFSVTAGLESMILGETEIFCQVKDAYSAAVAARTTGQLLNRAFHGAFAVSKHVRTRTAIGRGNTSYASAAHHMCRKLLPGARELTVLLLGAGEIAATVADFFHAQKGTRLTVLSRRESRAKELAARYGAEGHALAALPALLPGADVVIGGLAIETPILDAPTLAPLLSGRAGTPLLLVDLSVPRNFCPGIADLPGAKLVNINDLKEIVDRSLELRRDAVLRAGPILEAEVARLEAWSRGGDAASVMSRVSERVRFAAAACLMPALPDLAHVEMGQLRRLHRALMKLIMHAPKAVLERFPEPERPACYARLGKILCPETLAPEGSEPDPKLAFPRLTRACARRFRRFLERIDPSGEPRAAEETAGRLSAHFVRELLAPVGRIHAASICEGHRRALARDLALFLPE